MVRKYGVFRTEQQVIDALAQLEQAGFTTGEIKVLAKGMEHSRRIEAESHMHVDELIELTAGANPLQYSDDGAGSSAAGISKVPLLVRNGFPGFIAQPSMGIQYGAPFVLSEDEPVDILLALGLDQAGAELCSAELESGSLIIVVESDESKSLFDEEGGPDLSRLGIAEAVFRSCGAARIAEGS